MFLYGVKRCLLRGVIRVSENFTQGVGGLGDYKPSGLLCFE